jgi:DNA-binding MarR family transcriptional regulator
VSRRNRDELETAGVEEIRGWQTDQDMFDQAVADFARLNRTDTRCIDILQRHGPMTAGQLATEAHLTTGAITAVVDRLEQLGLVRRTRDTVDRRRVLVEATPRIDELLRPVFEPFVAQGREFLAGYSDEELAVLLRFFRHNRALLAEHTSRIHTLIAERDAPAGRGAGEG